MRKPLAGLAVLVAAAVIARALWPTDPETVAVAPSTDTPAAELHREPVRAQLRTPDAATPVTAATFSGDVSDAFTGALVPNAKVTFSNASQQLVKGDTDATGKFAIDVRLPGPFFLASVTAAGFQPLLARDSESSTLVVESGSSQLHLAIQPWVERQGVVNDLQHHPVSGATVSVRTPRPEAEVLKTNSGGEFRFRPLAGERWVIRHQGFLDYDVPLFVGKEAGGPWHYGLTPLGQPGGAFTFEGVVIDEADAGLTKVVVTARQSNPRRGIPLGTAQREVTDEQGRFAFRVDKEGPWWVDAETEFDQQTEEVFLDGGVTHVELKLERRTGVLVGRVTDPSGAPVTEFVVSLSAVDPRFARYVLARPSLLGIRSDDPFRVQRFVTASGDFRLTGLPPDVMGLGVEAAGFASALLPLEVAPERETRRDIALEAGASISGVVTRQKTGTPIGRASVRLVGSDRSPVRTSPDGTFTLRGLPPGSRELLLIQPAEADVQPLEFPIGDLKVGAPSGPVQIALSEKLSDKSVAEIIGIGIQTGYKKGEELKIEKLHPLGGARSAGLHEGDVIIAVEGEPTANQKQQDVFSRLRGAEGSLVRVTVLREKQKLDFSIVRRRLAF